MKLSQRQINDLLNLIDHSRRDISYGQGGSFGGYEEEDKKAEKESEKEIKSAERAIELIKTIIMQRD